MQQLVLIPLANFSRKYKAHVLSFSNNIVLNIRLVGALERMCTILTTIRIGGMKTYTRKKSDKFNRKLSTENSTGCWGVPWEMIWIYFGWTSGVSGCF